jgi:hypothetical protein
VRRVNPTLRLIFPQITENYELVYQSRRKCEIYRDTGVSKNIHEYKLLKILREKKLCTVKLQFLLSQSFVLLLDSWQITDATVFPFLFSFESDLLLGL